MTKPTTSKAWGEWTATEVMGWHKHEWWWRHGERHGRYLISEKQGCGTFWNPYNNDAHARELVGALNPYAFEITRGYESPGCQGPVLWSVVVTPGYSMERFYIDGCQRASIAICEAIWTVYEAKEGK